MKQKQIGQLRYTICSHGDTNCLAIHLITHFNVHVCTVYIYIQCSTCTCTWAVWVCPESLLVEDQSSLVVLLVVSNARLTGCSLGTEGGREGGREGGGEVYMYMYSMGGGFLWCPDRLFTTELYMSTSGERHCCLPLKIQPVQLF